MKWHYKNSRKKEKKLKRHSFITVDNMLKNKNTFMMISWKNRINKIQLISWWWKIVRVTTNKEIYLVNVFAFVFHSFFFKKKQNLDFIEFYWCFFFFFIFILLQSIYLYFYIYLYVCPGRTRTSKNWQKFHLKNIDEKHKRKARKVCAFLSNTFRMMD